MVSKPAAIYEFFLKQQLFCNMFQNSFLTIQPNNLRKASSTRETPTTSID